MYHIMTIVYGCNLTGKSKLINEVKSYCKSDEFIEYIKDLVETEEDEVLSDDELYDSFLECCCESGYSGEGDMPYWIGKVVKEIHPNSDFNLFKLVDDLNKDVSKYDKIFNEKIKKLPNGLKSILTKHRGFVSVWTTS